MKLAPILPFVLAALAVCVSAAQNPDQETERYYSAILADTLPPYGLGKIQSLLRPMPIGPLPDKQFNSLTLDEKFTYTMLHGDQWSQNCSGMPLIAGAEHELPAHPSPPFQRDEFWSNRQVQFLHQNRARVVQLLRSTMSLRHGAGPNIKAAVLEVNAYELIPDLEAVYGTDRRDLDILSLLMVLLKDAQYKPFTTCALYAKLYGPHSSHQSTAPATSANRKLVLDLAARFARTRA